jgi:hypothetical protein
MVNELLPTRSIRHLTPGWKRWDDCGIPRSGSADSRPGDGRCSGGMRDGIGATDAEANKGKGFCRTGMRRSLHNHTATERN